MAQRTPINRSTQHKVTIAEATQIAESMVDFVETVIVVLESDPADHPTTVGRQRRQAKETAEWSLDELTDALVATRMPGMADEARQVAEEIAEGQRDMADAMFDGLRDLTMRVRAGHLLAELAEYKYAASHGLRPTRAEPPTRGLFRRRRP
jgi:hypothetical protein